MVQDEDLAFGENRLLEADNPLLMPQAEVTRLLVTSDDVIHS